MPPLFALFLHLNSVPSLGLILPHKLKPPLLMVWVALNTPEMPISSQHLVAEMLFRSCLM